MKKIIEISAGEGGADRRLFIQDLANAYVYLSIKKGGRNKFLKNSSHKIQIEITSKNIMDDIYDRILPSREPMSPISKQLTHVIYMLRNSPFIINDVLSKNTSTLIYIKPNIIKWLVDNFGGNETDLWNIDRITIPTCCKLYMTQDVALAFKMKWMGTMNNDKFDVTGCSNNLEIVIKTIKEIGKICRTHVIHGITTYYNPFGIVMIYGDEYRKRMAFLQKKHIKKLNMK